MAWPVDSRFEVTHEAAPINLSSRRKRQKIFHEPWNSPALSTKLWGAATLSQTKDGLQWSYAAESNTATKLNAPSAPRKLYPESRPLSVEGSTLSKPRLAEQGGRFLRTYHPDVDIQLELLQSELSPTLDIPQSDRDPGSAYDPYAGNCAVVCQYPKWSSKRRFPGVTIAFPAGEVGQHLNIASVMLENGLVQTPHTAPVMTFPTGIQQIVKSPYQADPNTQHSPVIAIRTLTSITVCRLMVATDDELAAADLGRSVSAVRTTRLADINWSSLGSDGKLGVDVAMSPFGTTTALVVNELGSVYLSTFASGTTTTETLLKTPPSLSAEPDHAAFWRVAWGPSDHDIILAGDRGVIHTDKRTASSSSDLLKLTSGNEVVTSIEGPQLGSNPYMMCFNTTSKLVWIDSRQTRTSVLSWKHHREYDRTLEARTIIQDQEPVTFLTSRRNGLVSVYSVSPREEGLLYSHHEPYVLSYSPGTPVAPFRRAGTVFFHHPARQRNDSAVDMLELSSRGAIFGRVLIQSDGDIASSEEINRETRDSHIIEGNLGRDLGPLSTREHVTIDLRGFYEDVLLENKRTRPRSSLVEALDTLQRMPRTWQEVDYPSEPALTTFDVAFRAGDELTQTSRAGYLVGCSLNFPAIQQKGLAITDIARGADWHMNLLDALCAIDPQTEIPPITSTPADAFAKHRIITDATIRTGQVDHFISSQERELRACDDLALDLSLSCDIFSARKPTIPLQSPTEQDGVSEAIDRISAILSEATIQEAEPPDARFGYLQPRFDSSSDSESSHAHTKWKQPLGARLLVSEWDLGTNPDEYKYVDLYDPSLAQITVTPQTKPSASQSQPQSQLRNMPPTVISSQVRSTQPPTLKSTVPIPRTSSMSDFSHILSFNPSNRVIGSGSQVVSASLGWDPSPGGLQTQSQSQDYDEMPSTQVLPGRFGGRPSVGGKKKPKKRMVGF